MENEKLYSLREIGAMLGLSPDTLRRQARRGRLKAKKIGGKMWAADMEAIENYRLNNQKKYQEKMQNNK